MADTTAYEGQAQAARHDNANARFKRSYSNWVAWGVIIAAVAHFAFMAYFPQLRAADVRVANEALENVNLPPEVEIPPPPEQIARPATPTVAEVAIDEDITIAPTTFEDNPVETLPPPPPGANPADQPVFIARTVNPRVTNGSELMRLLERRYPPILKDAGIEGTVTLWVFVDEEGSPVKAQVQRSSGQQAFDQVALNVIQQAEFSPAYDRDRPVAVWISQDITFRITR